MALSVTNLVRKKSDKPPLIVIYGRGKMGKTTLASEFPNPVFIQTEDGGGCIELSSFTDGAMQNYSEVEEALESLASEDHTFKTLVIDSVTQLESLIWKRICSENNWNSIEDPGYGRGYVEADTAWRDFTKAVTWLRDNKAMNIVMIGHEDVKVAEDEEREDYKRHMLRLHKRADAILREHVDIVGFLNQAITLDKGKSGKEKARAVGSGQRQLNLSPRPTFEAGNRYNMPDKILINPGEGYAALAPYMPGQSKPQEAAA